MQKITLTCPNDGRKLRIALTALLKKGLISDARVQNSIKHYTLRDKKVQKEEKKLIIFWVQAEKKDQLFALFSQISGWSLENGSLQLLD